jgi:hypothetical protein
LKELFDTNLPKDVTARETDGVLGWSSPILIDDIFPKTIVTDITV